MTPNKNLAIQHALKNQWTEAISINKLLLEANPEDLDTLNRLAFAYMKSGDYDKSQDTYKKVLKLDKTNPIALKNSRKLEMLSTQKVTNSLEPQPQEYIGDQFIEEAGKTKTCDLKNCADKKTLLTVQAGESVLLLIKRSKIFIQTQDKKYLGALPDSVGSRLISLIKGGNEYRACIKSVDEKSVTVFIKETKKAAKFKNLASFSLAPTPTKTK